MARKVIDKYDLEAESEGAAMAHHNRIRVQGVSGKRLGKQRRDHDRGDAVAEKRVLARIRVEVQ